MRTAAVVPLDSPRTPIVAIRPCAPHAPQRAWFARYRRLETKLQDLPLVIWEALRRRYAPLASHAAGNGSRPDLEFVPWPCLLHAHDRVPARLGSFTVFSGAWASFALELFDDSRAMCAAAANCSSSRLRGTAVLSIESPSYLVSWQPPETNTTIVSSHLPAFPGSGGARFQLPYPTSAHFDGSRSSLPEVPPLSERTALAALVANTVLERAPHSVPAANQSSILKRTNAATIGRGPLRTLLHAECLNAPAGECLARGGHRGGSMIWSTNNATFASYASAVFCLQPWGDSATRKGFWDAVLAGCINAIFDHAGYNETDAWFGDHRQWTVRIPLTELSTPGGRGALGYLRELPHSRVARLHAAVLAVRGRVQYAIDPGTPGGDGVDLIVANVAKHFRQLRASGDLPKRHTGENSCRTIIDHICRQVRRATASRAAGPGAVTGGLREG